MATMAMRPMLLTSIGKKYLMGFTGLIWSGFVFTHMAGNLLIFVGADAYNSYGHAITSGYILYFAEAVLLGSILAHVILGVLLTIENRKSRGGRYAMEPSGSKGASKASKTMIFHGSMILVFLITHLLTFKYGVKYETTVNGVVMRDLYRLIVEVFHQPNYIAWYFFCLILVGIHLKHGVSSIFQSFGILNSRNQTTIKAIGIVYGLVVALGFISQPLFVFLNTK